MRSTVKRSALCLVLAAAVALELFVAAHAAFAQRTGGSGGASNWSSGSTSIGGTRQTSFGTNHDYSSRGSSTSFDSDGDEYHSRPGPMCGGQSLSLFLIVMALGAAFVLVSSIYDSRERMTSFVHSPRGIALMALLSGGTLAAVLVGVLPERRYSARDPPNPGQRAQMLVGERWVAVEVITPTARGHWRVRDVKYRDLNYTVAPQELRSVRLVPLAIAANVMFGIAALLAVLALRREIGLLGERHARHEFECGPEIQVLAFAVDASTRDWLRPTLERAVATKGNLKELIHNLRTLLQRASAGACLARHERRSLAYGPDAARAQFDDIVARERMRYEVESVRADAAGVRRITAPSDLAPRPEEGAGFMVVTMLAARRDAAKITEPADRASLFRALSALLRGGTNSLMALEVVWVPSDARDVMSLGEMAIVFPELRPLAEGMTLGRVEECVHCRKVFAADTALGRCPACGTPVQTTPRA